MENYVLSIKNVVKDYNKHRAVDNVSFDVKKGSIFGLLGPNGAGKTSLIRIITGITAADSGEIYIDGKKQGLQSSTDIGYLPEERGLYKKMKVGDQLMFLARIKGLSKADAKSKIDYWIRKFDIADWWNKKVEELSKGMQQKIQFISTVIHQPKLLILDEPFSGLDPINTNLIKDEIYRMRDEGTSIIFSTHRMEQVEEICEKIVLMNQGRIILNGNVAQIKEDYKENLFSLRVQDTTANINTDKFSVVEKKDNQLIIKALNEYSSNDILSSLINNGTTIEAFEEIRPSLNEIFIRTVRASHE